MSLPLSDWFSSSRSFMGEQPRTKIICFLRKDRYALSESAPGIQNIFSAYQKFIITRTVSNLHVSGVSGTDCPGDDRLRNFSRSLLARADFCRLLGSAFGSFMTFRRDSQVLI